MIKHHDQSYLGEERVYFILHPVVHHVGKVGQELKVGTALPHRGHVCLLACTPWLAEFTFIYHPGPLVQGWHCPSWGGTSHIHHQLPQACLQASGDIFFKLRFPLSKMTLAFVRLMWRQQSTCARPRFLRRKQFITWTSYCMSGSMKKHDNS